MFTFWPYQTSTLCERIREEFESGKNQPDYSSITKCYDPATAGMSAEVKNERCILTFELPGFKKEDVAVTIDHGVLTVRAKNSKREKTYRYKFADRYYTDGASSHLEDGILTVSVSTPKPLSSAFSIPIT